MFNHILAFTCWSNVTQAVVVIFLLTDINYCTLCSGTVKHAYKIFAYNVHIHEQGFNTVQCTGTGRVIHELFKIMQRYSGNNLACCVLCLTLSLVRCHDISVSTKKIIKKY